MQPRLRLVVTLGLTALLGACASSSFPAELVSFSEGIEVLRPLGPGTWEALFRERGFLLREEDGYHLFFTGSSCRGCPGRLGYATSQDGLSFLRHGDGPVYEETPLEDVMLVQQGGVYYLFGEGASDEMQLLTSADRTRWQRRGRVDIRYRNGSPMHPGPYGTPTALYENGTWFLFYERLDDGIWLATSQDLAVFRNVQDHPVISIGPQPTDSVRVALNQIFPYGGRYYALYNGQGVLPQWSIHLAVSDDLVHWEKYAGNPILPLAENKASAVAVHDGERVRLYTMDRRVEVHYGAVTARPIR